MAELQLPICSVLFLSLICYVYFSKGNLKTNENKLYSIMLISGLADSIIVSIERILVLDGNLNNINLLTKFVLQITNKIDFIVLIILSTAFFLYTILISFDNPQIKYKKVAKITTIINMIFYVVISFLNVELICSNNIISVTGSATLIAYIICGLYILLSVIITFVEFKKVTKKHIPIFGVIFLFIFLLFVYKNNPYIMVNSIVITFVIYLMYFTIENPDVKVLEEMHKAKKISDSANEEKAMFLYNTTNEIRKVTREIDSLANNILIETDNSKVNIEEVNNYAREIRNTTANFNTMTNELLDISQIDSANIRIYNDKYNIKIIIKELVQIYKNKCIDKKLDFRTSIASDIPDYLYGDSVGLKNVLTIILDNSIKYTDEGYVEFSVNTIMKRDVCRLIISIEDTGTGIKADNLMKIFAKKEEDTEEDRYNLDNNLYNAKRLITLMGGTIIPSSVYGKGTSVKIVLDQKIVSAGNENLTKYEEVYDKKKILLVDDNTSTVKIISKIFDDSNIVLETVSLGSECLDKVRKKEKYDLILLNEEMKPLDGITIMKKLNSIKTFNTKVILLTSNSNYEYDDDYLKYGFNDYILKPIDKDKFLEKIDKCLK